MPSLPPSPARHQRILVDAGQRLMPAASDLFLGWTDYQALLGAIRDGRIGAPEE